MTRFERRWRNYASAEGRKACVALRLASNPTRSDTLWLPIAVAYARAAWRYAIQSTRFQQETTA